MIFWIRSLVIVFAILTAIYLILTLWMRLRHRAKLVDEFNTTKPSITKRDYISAGMLKYNKSLRAKLAFLVYIIPLILTIILLYLAQS